MNGTHHHSRRPHKVAITTFSSSCVQNNRALVVSGQQTVSGSHFNLSWWLLLILTLPASVLQGARERARKRASSHEWHTITTLAVARHTHWQSHNYALNFSVGFIFWLSVFHLLLCVAFPSCLPLSDKTNKRINYPLRKNILFHTQKHHFSINTFGYFNINRKCKKWEYILLREILNNGHDGGWPNLVNVISLDSNLWSKHLVPQ